MPELIPIIQKELGKDRCPLCGSSLKTEFSMKHLCNHYSGCIHPDCDNYYIPKPKETTYGRKR